MPLKVDEAILLYGTGNVTYNWLYRLVLGC